MLPLVLRVVRVRLIVPILIVCTYKGVFLKSLYNITFESDLTSYADDHLPYPPPVSVCWTLASLSLSLSLGRSLSLSLDLPESLSLSLESPSPRRAFRPSVMLWLTWGTQH